MDSRMYCLACGHHQKEHHYSPGGGCCEMVDRFEMCSCKKFYYDPKYDRRKGDRRKS